MGPRELMPEFPELEWTGVPESHRFATRHIQECNWFQALEGGFDTSHLSFLHRGDTPDGRPRPLPEFYEVVPTDFGMVTGSGRTAPDGSTSWTVNIMGMPFHKVISRGGTGEYPIGAHVWVPIDDENCMIYSVEYRHDRPLSDADLERSKNWLYIHAETLPGSDRCLRNLDNDFLVDRELQRSGKSFTGLRGFGIQDCGIQESMGPIVDRTLEHLGVSDTHIIKLRRQMLRIVREHETGKPIPGLRGDSYRVRSAGFSTSPGVRFEDAVIDQVRIETHLLSMAK
jgi:hypothetical protein